MSAILSKSILLLYKDEQYSIPTKYQLISYIVFMMVSIFLVLLAVHISTKIGTFHQNLKRLYLCAILSWFENCLSKILALIAQISFYDMKEDKFSPTGDELIQFSAYFRYHWSYFFCSLPFFMLIERGLATFYLQDYENQTRNWIFHILFFFNFSIASLMSFLAIQEVVNVSLLMSHIFSLCILSIAGFLFLYKYNKTEYNNLEKHNRRATYTLSIKYQLRENLMILESMKYLMAVVTVAICIVLTSMIIPVILEVPSHRMWIIHAIPDYLFHFAPIYMVPTCLMTIQQNRRYLIQMAKKYGICANTKEKERTVICSSDGDVYFNMFQKSIVSLNTAHNSHAETNKAKMTTTEKFMTKLPQ